MFRKQLIAVAIGFPAILAYAERPTDYTPPSLGARLTSAIILLGRACLLLSVTLVALQRIVSRPAAIPTRRYRIFWAASLALLLAGVGASVNYFFAGENGNPEWTGSFFVAAIFPVGFLLLVPEKPNPIEWMIAAGLTPVVWLGVFLLLEWMSFNSSLAGW